MQFIETALARHKIFWKKDKVFSLFVGTSFLAFAFIVHKQIDVYLRSFNGTPVGDLLLDLLPVVPIEYLVVQGTLFVAASAIVLCLLKPKYLNFTLKAYALFVLIRAVFVSLTHLGIDPGQAGFSAQGAGAWIYNTFFATQNDFFFSGHTGAPFLMALVFWKEKTWRSIYLILSLAMGAGVLLAHIHYSIDVFAAPFIAYGIFAVAKNLFAPDYNEIAAKQLL